MSTGQNYVVYMPYDSFSGSYVFTMQEDARVQDLKQAIRNHPGFEHHVKNGDLILFKCDLPIETPIECFKRVPGWLHTHAKDAQIQPVLRLSKYFPDGPAPYENEKIDVLVITHTMIAHLLASPPPEPDFLYRPSEPDTYSDAVTFRVRCENNDAANPKPMWETVTDRNGYYVRGDLPRFVADVVKRARRAADNDKGSAEHLLQCVKRKLDGGSQVQIVRDLLTDDKSAVPYSCWNLEMIHHVHALACMKSPSADELTFDRARSIVFESFKNYWLTEVEGAQCTFAEQSPFSLIAEAQSESGEVVGRFKYRPRPDVALLKYDFPRFLVEFDSSDNQKDEFRLQVQMTCALRLVVAAQKEARINDEQFSLMGAFFAKNWDVHRYFFYVEEEKIRYRKRVFQMKVPNDLTTFLFEFYNYTRHVKDNDTLGDKKQEIAKLAQKIDALGYRSLYTSVTKSKKHSQPGKDHDDTDDEADRSSSKPVRAAIAVALRGSGFEVLDPHLMEFEPLVELPAHVVEGTSRNGEGIIAKLPHKNSEELSLLRKLSSQRSPHNHIIPLLETVQSSLGPLIVLPRAISLSDPVVLQDVLKRKFVQLCHELVEGVAFLHRQKIAHLDLKPDNLVHSFKHNRLYIIDLDIAMQCKDVDEMAKISCGTRGWSAPEIVHDRNKPSRAFSPIRADLWSCGKLLRSFVEVANQKDEDISMLTHLLMDLEPRRRPLLHEIVDEGLDIWTSGRLHQRLMRHINDQGQQATTEGVVRSKRARSDDSGEGLASKVPCQASFQPPDFSFLHPFFFHPPRKIKHANTDAF